MRSAPTSASFPWAHLRQAQKLLRLVNKYGAARVDAACRRALSFELVNVRRVETIVRQSLEQQATPERGSKQMRLHVIPSARFLRAAGSFTHHPHEPKGESE